VFGDFVLTTPGYYFNNWLKKPPQCPITNNVVRRQYKHAPVPVFVLRGHFIIKKCNLIATFHTSDKFICLKFNGEIDVRFSQDILSVFCERTCKP